MKELVKFGAGLALAGALLWWVLRRTDPQMLWETVRQASLPGLLLAAVLGLGQNVFRVLRWRALLEPVRSRVPLRPMFDAVILGYATSWTIPGRLGELVRPALLSGRERIPLGPCLGSVLADRLLDGLAVLALLGVGILVTPMSEASVAHASLVQGSAIGLVLVIALPIAVLLIASGSRGRFERLLVDDHGWRGWIGRTILALSSGIESFKRPALLLKILFHTAMTWLMIAGSTWVGVRSCGVDISFGAILIVLPLLVLGIALPTPGGAGGYHAAMRVGLVELFQVSEPLAVGAGLLQHAVVVLPVILLGGVLLVVDRIPLQDLLQAARQVRGMGASSPSEAPPTARPTENLS